MLVELQARLEAVQDIDPLHGLWSRIDYIIDQEGKSPLHELLVATGNFLNELPLDGVRWAELFKKRLQRESSTPVNGALDLYAQPVAEGSWPTKLLGIGPFAEFSARRSAAGRNFVPLVLAGKKGSGKRTLGRYFAMTLLCDGPSPKPCITQCDACPSVISNSTFDFLPIDASKLSADSMEDDLTEKLDNLRKAIRNKQIVVMLFNAEHILHLC
jgi:hypothetical protein